MTTLKLKVSRLVISPSYPPWKVPQPFWPPSASWNPTRYTGVRYFVKCYWD